MKKKYLLYPIFLLLLVCPSVLAQPDSTPPVITTVYPDPGIEITTNIPEIRVNYTDISDIDLSSVNIILDNLDITEWEETRITQTSISHTVPSLFKLIEGNHTISVSVSDIYGNTAQKEWIFSVNTTLPPAIEEALDITTILTYVGLGAGVAAAGFIVYILYLHKTKHFTFQKYFIQHPIQKTYLILYLPLAAAFIFILIGFAYVNSNSSSSPFDYEYVFIGGILIAIIVYALDSQLERRRIGRYERAFSQFLFELADAVRGGLDPAKAVIELTKTDTSPLKKHLKIASDSIIIGRPFDEVMESMIKPMKSELIKRYATLVGEASQIGGETSVVIYRAAKDMDDMIQIDQERRRQLNWQTAIIYISFTVLLIIIYQLIELFPDIGTINLGLLGAGIEQENSREIARMSLITLKKRFFHLVLINSFGAGILIGEFIEGKVKYGLIHSIIMIIVSLVFFVSLIL